MGTLHERACHQCLPMLQVSKHVIKADHSIPDLDFVLLSVAHLFNCVIMRQLHMIEVHPGAYLLDLVHYLATCRPCKVGVVVLVPLDVVLVKLCCVLYGHYQVDAW